MKVADNSSLYAAQDRRSASSIAERTKIANQNRANAEVAERVELQKDRVHLRSSSAVEVAPLESSDLESILAKISGSIFGSPEKAMAAQGNLDPKSVLALLED